MEEKLRRSLNHRFAGKIAKYLTAVLDTDQHFFGIVIVVTFYIDQVQETAFNSTKIFMFKNSPKKVEKFVRHV